MLTHQLIRTAGGLACLLLHNAMAQTPTATVNDYLEEVRIFAHGSAEFSQIASKLGVAATLPTLGEGASLVVAIRNDSAGAVELRILFNVTKDVKTIPYRLEVGRRLKAGESTLTAPGEVGGRLFRLMIKSGLHQGIVQGGNGTESLDAYQGATVTASIDSATLADGLFIGADTQHVYADLVAEDAAKRKFFSDLLALNGKTEAEITSALTTAASQAPVIFSRIPNPERALVDMSVMRLQHFGMAKLFEWATQENATLAAKPKIHN